MMKSSTNEGLVTNRFRPVWVLACIALVVSTLTRIVLMLISFRNIDWTIGQVSGIFTRGLLFDLASTSFLLIPLALHLGFMSDIIYKRPWRWIFLTLLFAFVIALAYSNLIPVEFNKELHWAIAGYAAIRLFIFYYLGNQTETFRSKWRIAIIRFDLFLFTFLILFNAISEYFFWDEFAARYNFIAVDYLVYTNEVIGNIRESYPILPIVGGIALLTVGIQWLFRRYIRPTFAEPPRAVVKFSVLAILLLLPVLVFYGIKTDWRNFSTNTYANELSGNGLYDFGYAFRHNELDFDKFYDTIQENEAFVLTRQSISQQPENAFNNTPNSVHHAIRNAIQEKRMNVVLISVESLSADFLGAFGNKKNLTPNLDTLASKSLFFKRAYASGTRTVRGLEALSLSIPPPPGQSVVKREDNKGWFTLASVFKSKGYTTQYIYGGYSYFDNMKDFFGGNGYQVIDRSSLKKEDIHYANVWGVADEDLFQLALQTLDSNASAGKPFFSHIMTVSNHRPYTYPENRIDISPSTHSREGAVKYTDFAIGKFIHDAASKSWFNETIFVIVADHCASASGKTALPLNGYHIPLMIYAPGLYKHAEIERLTAQIDIGPTILGLLHFNYDSQFYGHDIFNTAPQNDRAFISTYEGLGYLTDSILVVQSPVKKVKAYKPDFETGLSVQVPVTDSVSRMAKALYQTSNWLAKNHHP